MSVHGIETGLPGGLMNRDTFHQDLPADIDRALRSFAEWNAYRDRFEDGSA